MWQGHHWKIRQFGERNGRPPGYLGDRVRTRQYDVKYFAAHPFCFNKIWHVIHVGGAKVGSAVANVLQYSAMHAFAQNDFNAGARGSIFGDNRWQQAVCDRHDAGEDDLAALFLADLTHAADADTQVIEHTLSDGHEFLTRRSDCDAPRASVE